VSRTSTFTPFVLRAARRIVRTVILIALPTGSVGQGQSVVLALSSGLAPAGGSVTLNLSLSGTAPAAVQWTLGYSTVDFGSATMALGPAATAANKQISCNNNAGSAECILWGLNTTTISSGVVATVTLPINHTTDSSSALQLTAGAAAAATGAVLATSTTGASVTIQPGLSGFTCSPVSIASPATSSCTATLTAAAPAGGAAITVTANPASAVTLSTPVTVAPGSLSIPFNVTADVVAASTPVMLTASYLGVNQGFGVTVTPPVTSQISSLSPTSATVGTAVTITGSNFGSVQGASSVTFNGTAATPTSWSATSIVAPVPAGAASGNVIVTVGGVASNGVAFNVLLPTPQPSAVSVSPSSGSGASQTFTFLFTDSENVANMTGLGMLFSSSPATFTNACDLFYDGTAGVLGLRWDNGQGQDYRATGAQTVLQNSQCSIGTSTFTITGLTMTIALNITFKAGFNGAANIYMYASDYSYGINTGWVQRGTFTVLQTPAIGSLSPASAAVGAAVTITGTNFGTTQASSTVTFNGTAATPTSWSATSIVVPVPAGATAGNVVVTVNAVASNGVAFTVLPTAAISSLSPASATVGTAVTIAGTNFGATQGTSTVTFNGTAATPTSWSATSIAVPVPAGAASGNVVVKAGGVASNGSAFTVLPTPNISSLSPASAAVGTAVTITGTNFGSTQAASSVTFNGTAATPTSWSATSIVAPVPAGAASGNVVVTVGGVASNGVAFNVSLPTPQPSAVSVSPSSGSGASQTFTFVFSDAQNVANMTGLGMLFSSSPATFTNACDLFYDGTAGVLGLRWDSGQGQDYRATGAQTPLQNSQCSIGTSAYTISGLTMTIALNITFKGGFDGAANIYMYASDYSYGINTGWVQRGTFTVGAATTPVVNSVAPSSGSGASQRFTITASDAGGGSVVDNLSVLFAPTLNLVNACYLVYDGTANTISLGYENPANGSTAVAPGSNAVVSNNQCNLQAFDSTVTFGPTTITLTLDLTFNGSFAGPKNIYVSAGVPGYSSGWVTAGTWTVTGGTPTADSVMPSSGSGSTVRLTFVGSDSVSETNITGMTMLVTGGSTATSTSNACYLVYDRNAGTIGLYNDAGTALVGTKGIGYSTQLTNSQCAVGYTLMTESGDSVQFLLELFFTTPAFDGAKTVYFQTNEATGNSGMTQRGTWTVQ